MHRQEPISKVLLHHTSAYRRWQVRLHMRKTAEKYCKKKSVAWNTWNTWNIVLSSSSSPINCSFYASLNLSMKLLQWVWKWTIWAIDLIWGGCSSSEGLGKVLGVFLLLLFLATVGATYIFLRTFLVRRSFLEYTWWRLPELFVCVHI